VVDVPLFGMFLEVMERMRSHDTRRGWALFYSYQRPRFIVCSICQHQPFSTVDDVMLPTASVMFGNSWGFILTEMWSFSGTAPDGEYAPYAP
jgi:hypothetical protein